MRLLANWPLLAVRRDIVEYFDDFLEYTSGDIWTSLSADGGVTAPAEGDAEHGRVQMATGATDNNEVMVRSTNEVMLFQADYTWIVETRLQYTEANTDDANVAVGIANAAAANLLLDDGAGDSISDSGALIFKVDGGTVWRCMAVSGAGTVSETAAVETAGGTDYQTLTLVGKTTIGASEMEVTYFLNQQPLTDSNGKPIKHSIVLGTPTEMRVVAGYVKAGSANSETLNLDYAYFAGKRL